LSDRTVPGHELSVYVSDDYNGDIAKVVPGGPLKWGGCIINHPTKPAVYLKFSHRVFSNAVREARKAVTIKNVTDR
jgi:hypothetical protein